MKNKKTTRKFSNFLYSVLHPVKSYREVLRLRKENHALREKVALAQDSERRSNASVAGYEQAIRMQRGDLATYEKQIPALQAATSAFSKMLGEMSGAQLKEIYDAVGPHLDRDGFRLFAAAQHLLGKFNWSTFAYEDNRGHFEHCDGHELLKYLLVEYDGKLGEANANRERWSVEGCYEKCVNFTIDRTTPEYLQFEKDLYTLVLDSLEVFRTREVEVG